MHTLKRFIPTPLWSLLRRAVFTAVDGLRALTPYLRTRMYRGLTLYYNRGNTIIERLTAEPVFEEAMSNKIIADLQAQPDPVYLDIGANLGLIIANVLHAMPRVSVVAFEPGPRQAALLTKTIEHNGLSDRVRLHRDALAETVGETTFYTHAGRDIAKDGLLDTGRGETTHAIRVSTTTLDRWWTSAGKPRVSVVKMDTEGAELFILRGALTFLAACKPVLYLEIEPSNLKVYPYRADDILSFLTEAGYMLETLSGERVTPSTLAVLLTAEDTFRALPAA